MYVSIELYNSSFLIDTETEYVYRNCTLLFGVHENLNIWANSIFQVSSNFVVW